jgi:hypothetical protein
MKPNSKTQNDRNLDFDGMAGDGVNRGANKFSGNKYSGVQNPNKLFNEGTGPRVGNQDHRTSGGPSATKDAYRPAPTASVPADGCGKDMFYGSANPQMRNPSGTRAFAPSAGQNYNGNPDRINVSGYSMGDGTMSKGTNPVKKQLGQGSGPMNFGPKSQY